MPKKAEETVVKEETKKTTAQPEKSDAAVAAEIEVKKTVRKAGRKAKEAVEDAVKQAASSDAAAAAEIEVKKTVRKAGRKAKEAAEMVEKTIKKATLNIIIESPMGGSISTDEIAAKVPNGASAVYVRVDENKLYWVKGKETGSVDIWA
jgi:hypothetical protein